MSTYQPTHFPIGKRINLPFTNGSVQALIIECFGRVAIGYSYTLRWLNVDGTHTEATWPEDVLREANPPIPVFAASMDKPARVAKRKSKSKSKKRK